MTHKLDSLLQSLELSNASLPVRESVLRKFVATNKEEIRGWIELINILAMNESWQEFSRLANQASQQFPHEPFLTFLAATGMANLQAIDQALQKISSEHEKLHEFSLANHLLGELLLVSNPNRAKKAFESLLAKEPQNSLAEIGISNANSLIDTHGSAEVVFFQAYSWHRSIQQSIFEELINKRIGCVMTQSPWLVQALQPKVVVLSDVPPNVIRRIRYSLPATKIVNTRHGLGDKNYAHHASTIVDYVCVSSEYVAASQISAGLISRDAVWTTGFSQMDPIFKSINRSQKNYSKKYPHIVFAPTFTTGLNSGELIGEDPVAALRADRSQWQVTVRPHPHMARTHPMLLNAWQRSMSRTPNTKLDIDFEKSPADLLCSADLLVSDFSSVALQFIALDRPIVCLTQNERATKSPFFSDDSYEVRLKRAALTVSNNKQLTEAIRSSMEVGQPDSIFSERRILGNELFGSLRDGKAAIRIAEKIKALLA